MSNSDNQHHIEDSLERDFERNPQVSERELPPLAATSRMLVELGIMSGEEADQWKDEMKDNRMMENIPVISIMPTTPDLKNITIKKRHHDALCLEGVCSFCCHCGLALTDAQSIEIGMGKRCAGRGYFDTPEVSDEIQAMIDLAEFPELVEFLMKNYKPKGIRGLMNGLVHTASLNRKHAVFAACCDAIDSLGYKRLSSTLRQSLAVVEVRKYKADPSFVSVWVKRSVWNFRWSRELECIFGTKRNSAGKGMLVLIADGKAYTTLESGEKAYNKDLLCKLLLKHFEGYVVKLDEGSLKINLENIGKIFASHA